jgi:23S rRNA pseudouridine1911/1915/1917 synthase
MVAEAALSLVSDRAGERLDVFLARAAAISRAAAQRLIAEGAVSASGVPRRRPAERLQAGERLEVRLPPPRPSAPEPEAVPLRIVYEDDHLLVIDKPAGMTVHPAPGHARGTLVNAVLAHCPDLPGIGGVQRPGIVHRLDKDTSGLIVVAKSEAAHRVLASQLKERRVEKTYLALVQGRLEPAAAVIDAPIGRDPSNRRRMAIVRAGGREARTAYVVRASYPDHTLVEARPETGRTHQVRVHFASLGRPLAGDVLYGGCRDLAPRQFLHAWRLRFRHPVDGRELSFEAPLPADLEGVIAELDRHAAHKGGRR